MSVALFANMFSCSEGCLFILFMVSFAMQKLLSLIRSHLLIFCFYFHYSGRWIIEVLAVISEEKRWKTEASRRGVRGGEGPFAPQLPPPFWLSTGVRAPPLSLLPPSSNPPSSQCPGAGSRRDTGPDPCPSCPGSAGSGPSGPGGQAEARTPGVRPLPRVGMGPCPPSE